MLGGMPVTVNHHLCQPVFVRWVKDHKKSRIKKKWRKKYGAVMRCQGHCYQLAGVGLLMCPCVHAEMMKAVEGRPDPMEAILTAPLPLGLAFSTLAL